MTWTAPLFLLLSAACSGSPEARESIKLNQEALGPAIVLSGTVEGLESGQVRFLESFSDGLAPVCAAALKGGQFAAEAPRNNAPVYVAATGSDGSWTALDEAVPIGEADISVALPANNHPAWADDLKLDQLLVYEDELRRGGL